MSVYIDVGPSKPVNISDILPKICGTLKILLGLTFEPELSVVVKNDETDARPDYVDPKRGDAFYVRANGIEEVTRVLSSDRGDFFIVLPRWNGRAVGAATAIAMAEHFGSEIVDSESGLTTEEYLKPSELMQRIK